MDDFALVCEGVSDYAVLRNILTGNFQGVSARKPVINQVQPDPEEKHGGWSLVIKYLEEGLYEKAFQFNRYLVVQIDTDVAQDYGLNLQGHNVEEAVGKVLHHLLNIIGSDDASEYKDRFLFAVCVDELECWLLPLWYSGAQAEKKTGCLQKLGTSAQLKDHLKAKKLPWIRPEEKDMRSYDEASREYRKKKSLGSKGVINPSLKIFLDELARKDIQLLEDN